MKSPWRVSRFWSCIHSWGHHDDRATASQIEQKGTNHKSYINENGNSVLSCELFIAIIMGPWVSLLSSENSKLTEQGVLACLYSILVSQLTTAMVSMVSTILNFRDPILEARLNPIFLNRRLTPRPSVPSASTIKTNGDTENNTNIIEALTQRGAPLEGVSWI